MISVWKATARLSALYSALIGSIANGGNTIHMTSFQSRKTSDKKSKADADAVKSVHFDNAAQLAMDCELGWRVAE